jgi:Fe-S-cluster containining protein
MGHRNFGFSAFSEFYAQWLASEPGPEMPDESSLDCGSCRGPFAADLKCCTYFPFVPNFSIGAILHDIRRDNDSAKKLRLAGALAEGFVSPLGLFPSLARQRREKEAGPENFGRVRELICPFFDSATLACGIWAHRPGVCQSYFCVSQSGQAGLDAWKANEERLNVFEWTLAHEVLWQCGYTLPDVRRMEELRQQGGACSGDLWFEYADRTEDFFLEAYRVALSIKA